MYRFKVVTRYMQHVLKFQKVSDALYLRLGKAAKAFNPKQIHDKDLTRKLSMISDIGVSALPNKKLTRS